MSTKSYLEILCSHYHWFIKDYIVRITRLSRRSFTWRVYDQENTLVKWGKDSSAEGAFRSAELYIKTLKKEPVKKSLIRRFWDWLWRK